jgi:tetratricopeptide (TPR) repeat protein
VGTARVLGNVAELEFAAGNPEQAVRAASEALEIHASKKNGRHIANIHNNLATYRMALGDYTGARESVHEALHLARQARWELGIAVGLQHLGLLAALSGDARRGSQLLGCVDAHYAAMGTQREPTEQWGYDKLTAALRETLSADEIAQLSAEGAEWSEDRAVEEALQV